MHYYEVALNRIFRLTADTFTYSSSEAYSIGQLVVVTVGSHQNIGVIIRATKQPPYETKPILSIVESTPLPPQLVELFLWMQKYYSTHLATVLQTTLPRGLLTKRRAKTQEKPLVVRERTNFVFTKEQADTIQQITNMGSGTALLHGVTGSGKTYVYIELARQALLHGKSVIILVPEIALTSQLVAELSNHFDDIILAHSRQTEATRHAIWREALNSTTPRVVIGPRSALFLPLAKIGLIVIDEAHEPSFKQEKAPRYSALRTASVLAAHHGAKLILGSATPTISDFFLALQTNRPILSMTKRARSSQPPTVHRIDMTKKELFKKHRFLSDRLLTTLENTFDNGGQALVFHNRRGSAPLTLCESCGWSATCSRCFTPLTLHADKHILECHICAKTSRVPTSCPECHEANIIHKGIGTKLIESELKKIFPNQTIARFDGDSGSDETLDKKYKELYEGSIDLIIGTQVVAKGLDLPKLRSVAVIQADAGLALPDYTASERTFQLLAQAVGRVGRSHHPTTVIVQSFQPSHPAIASGIQQDFSSFYQHTLNERRQGNFPPFCYLLKLTCVYKTEASAIKNAQKLAKKIKAEAPHGVDILGPTPSFYERLHGTYRWQIILKAKQRANLIDILRLVPNTHWQSELDPVSLL